MDNDRGPMTEDREMPIRAMREAAKLSLRELARRTGINHGRLSVIERGLSLDERERVNRVLGEALTGGKPQ